MFSNPIFCPSKYAFPSHEAFPHCLEYTVLVMWTLSAMKYLLPIEHLPQLARVWCWVISVVDFGYPVSHSEWPQKEQEGAPWPLSDRWHIPSTVWNRSENGSFNTLAKAGVNLNGIGLDDWRLARGRSLCSLVFTASTQRALDKGIRNPGTSGCSSLIELTSLRTWGQARLLNWHVAHSIPFSPWCTTPYPPSLFIQIAPSFPTLTRSRDSFIIKEQTLIKCSSRERGQIHTMSCVYISDWCIHIISSYPSTEDLHWSLAGLV